MKWLIAFSMMVVLGAGCTSYFRVEDFGPPTLPVISYLTLENDDYTITFPDRWRDVGSFDDFSGYSGGLDGSDSYAVLGRSTVYTLPDGPDSVPMFVIMKIDLTDKAKMSSYPTERYLGENSTHAFYGGVVGPTGPWAFLYIDDTFGKYAADIDEIFKSVEVK